MLGVLGEAAVPEAPRVSRRGVAGGSAGSLSTSWIVFQRPPWKRPYSRAASSAIITVDAIQAPAMPSPAGKASAKVSGIPIPQLTQVTAISGQRVSPAPLSAP